MDGTFLQVLGLFMLTRAHQRGAACTASQFLMGMSIIMSIIMSRLLLFRVFNVSRWKIPVVSTITVVNSGLYILVINCYLFQPLRDKPSRTPAISDHLSSLHLTFFLLLGYSSAPQLQIYNKIFYRKIVQIEETKENILSPCR